MTSDYIDPGFEPKQPEWEPDPWKIMFVVFIVTSIINIIRGIYFH